jgi:hypothetical protein
MGNVDLFLAGFIDQQQSGTGNWLGHKAIAPEIDCKLAGITGLMLRKLPHASTRKGFVSGDRHRQKFGPRQQR